MDPKRTALQGQSSEGRPREDRPREDRRIAGTLYEMFRKLMERIDRMMGRGVIDEELYEELEEALLQADTNIHTTGQILEELRQAVRDEKITEAEAMKRRLRLSIADRFKQEPVGFEINESDLTVWVFVGVNGAGKTTTIAKCAHWLRTKYDLKVMLAAGDTFRAAAIDQLEVWAERTGSEIVRGKPGADSGSVIFDAIQAAKARGCDIVLADTAGRQQSKESLMNELAKVVRITEKSLGRKPDEVLLVLDANTGQNAISQAEGFGKSAAVTGLVLTKIDGTARGGALIGIYERLKIPIKLIGTGEKVTDLIDFRPQRFVDSLFDS